MIRALLRLLAMIALSIAVIMAVLDATRSIAAETVILTPLGASWASVSPNTLERFEELVTQNLPGFLWDGGVMAILLLPGFVVFAALALLFYLAGRRPRQPTGRFAHQR